MQGRDLDDADLDEWAVAHGAPEPGITRLRWDVRHHFVATVPGFLADLDDLVGAERPDVLVMDNAFMAGGLAARRHHLPSVLFSVTPLALASVDTAPFGLGLQPPRTGWDGLRYAVLGWFTQKVVFGGVQRAAHQVVADAGLPVPEGFFLDWVQTSATRMLHTSVPGFEYPRSDLPENVELVGPFLPGGVDRFRPPAWWDDVLEARATGRPVVVVTQGTVATDPQRLLWPAIDALADEDVLVVATTEQVGYPANVRAAPFVPFDRLLPLADVLITNGGFGGVQQALAAGVPVLVAGRTEDKAEVGARVVWSGAGLALATARGTDATTAQAVRAGVRRVLDSPSFARRAGELAVEYGEHDGVARAVSVITDVAGSGR
ncbi:glycosyltransferase [Cellulomonas fengjieae]|uniref:glycosyltransferase n=1 Tax=Cellulomonas fengjieae TaxID=2819978 RepID=UPI001FB8B337|nr:nucleotide disphospho-sugar-binding domain-containing protein [Cellulomonas fengjieae]